MLFLIMDEGRPMVSSNKRPLKSLSDMLKGKQGRFHKTCLVNVWIIQEGRWSLSVRISNCTNVDFPKNGSGIIWLFIFHRLIDYQEVHTIKTKRKLRKMIWVWAILEEVVKEHPISLNRAPTLHRLGIQAFEPVLIEGKAIQLHPLVVLHLTRTLTGTRWRFMCPSLWKFQLSPRFWCSQPTTSYLLPMESPWWARPRIWFWDCTGLREREGWEGKIFSNKSDVSSPMNMDKSTSMPDQSQDWTWCCRNWLVEPCFHLLYRKRFFNQSIVIWRRNRWSNWSIRLTNVEVLRPWQCWMNWSGSDISMPRKQIFDQYGWYGDSRRKIGSAPAGPE